MTNDKKENKSSFPLLYVLKITFIVTLVCGCFILTAIIWWFFIKESEGRGVLSYGYEEDYKIPDSLPPIAANPCYNDIYTCSSEDRESYCVDYFPYSSNVQVYCQSFCRKPGVENKNDDKCNSEEMCRYLEDEYESFEITDQFNVCNQ